MRIGESTPPPPRPLTPDEEHRELMKQRATEEQSLQDHFFFDEGAHREVTDLKRKAREAQTDAATARRQAEEAERDAAAGRGITTARARRAQRYEKLKMQVREEFAGQHEPRKKFMPAAAARYGVAESTIDTWLTRLKQLQRPTTK
jgi:type IV secretory pathway VirB10-like protein